MYPRLTALCPLALLSACGLEGHITSGGDYSSSEQPPAIFVGPTPCSTLDFDSDGLGAPIGAGSVLTDVYAELGVEIRVWKGGHPDKVGLPVAFDSNAPTGGDDDLAFTGLGNLLISQESFDDADVAAGFVAEPDDDARGATFELVFDQPRCVTSLTMLDLDFDEPGAKIKLYDAADERILTHHVDPTGNGERADTVLPDTGDCNVARMTISICSSGAVDNIEICEACPGGVPAREWYLDFDADGYGDPAEVVVACEPPTRYVDNALDCDDTDDAINPDAAEMCDGVDNDCDGDTDEPDAIDAIEWYADDDGDGFGDAASPVLACQQPAGTSPSEDDCDDTDADVFPGAPDPAGDGVDSDCDGIDG